MAREGQCPSKAEHLMVLVIIKRKTSQMQGSHLEKVLTALWLQIILEEREIKSQLNNNFVWTEFKGRVIVSLLLKRSSLEVCSILGDQTLLYH